MIYTTQNGFMAKSIRTSCRSYVYIVTHIYEKSQRVFPVYICYIPPPMFFCPFSQPPYRAPFSAKIEDCSLQISGRGPSAEMLLILVFIALFRPENSGLDHNYSGAGRQSSCLRSPFQTNSRSAKWRRTWDIGELVNLEELSQSPQWKKERRRETHQVPPSPTAILGIALPTILVSKPFIHAEEPLMRN